MSYDSDVMPVMDVDLGYEKISNHYVGYHRWLDSFDKGERRKFLPRSLSGLDILDIGAGDGRTFSFFSGFDYASYVALDVAPSLLQKHPAKNVKLVVHDVNDGLPFDDESFDLLLSFFLLEHIEDIYSFMEEAYRVMGDDARYVLTYFPQRRDYVHRMGNEQFKIRSYSHRFEDIEAAASDAFFSIDYVGLFDGRAEIGRAYCFSK